MKKQDTGMIEIRPAQTGDGQALYDVTKRSVNGLAAEHYSKNQITGWMGNRTAQTYEEIIRENSTYVAVENGKVVGFVDAVPG